MEKLITSPNYIASHWITSPAYLKVTRFITNVNRAIKGSEVFALETAVPLQIILELLKDIEIHSRDVTLLEVEQQRFGNKAFRHLCSYIVNNTKYRLELLGVEKCDIEELHQYLTSSFGNSERLDYGTGHELNFIAFLTVVDQIISPKTDNLDIWYKQLGLIVFPEYQRVVRSIQRKFSLEPAGSHGVWGLDDYYFIPFLWGSSQLIGHENEVHPSKVVEESFYANLELRKNFMYLDSLYWIASAKQAHFSMHSPLLYDISSLESWEKINSGLWKMYQNEVLGKFPVVQHFLFGRNLSFE